jgi:hypothetical protein
MNTCWRGSAQDPLGEGNTMTENLNTTAFASTLQRLIDPYSCVVLNTCNWCTALF